MLHFLKQLFMLAFKNKTRFEEREIVIKSQWHLSHWSGLNQVGTWSPCIILCYYNCHGMGRWSQWANIYWTPAHISDMKTKYIRHDHSPDQAHIYWRQGDINNCKKMYGKYQRSDIRQVLQEPQALGAVSANIPRNTPRHLLVRAIFKDDEKLARWSIWAAMLAESTTPSRKKGGKRQVFQGSVVGYT